METPVPQAPAGELQAVQALGQPSGPPRIDGGIHVLTVVGQIEGHILLPPKNKTTKYEHVIPQLVAVEQSPSIKGLLIILNTVGGDIEAGLAIAEMIRTLSKPSVSLVLGGGHSIGVPIAVAATRSFIAGTATMTIHPIRLTGLVIGVPQTYEYLDKMQDRVIRFIVENSNVSEAKLRELMFRTGELMRDVGTVLVGPEAVRTGIIDALGGVREAVAELTRLIRERHAPHAPGPHPAGWNPPGLHPPGVSPPAPAFAAPGPPAVHPPGLHPPTGPMPGSYPPGTLPPAVPGTGSAPHGREGWLGQPAPGRGSG